MMLGLFHDGNGGCRGEVALLPQTRMSVMMGLFSDVEDMEVAEELLLSSHKP